MDGSKAIIEKILSDAREKVKEINADADSSCSIRIADAEIWAEKYTAAQTEILEKDAESIVSGKKLNAELDVKKAVLKAKRETVEKVFSLAYKKLLSLDKGEVVMVGDNLNTDILGAKRAGITSVWLNRHDRKPEDVKPTYEITNLLELLPILED